MNAPDDPLSPETPTALPRTVLDEVERLDVAMYAAVARTPTPTIDRFMSRLSSAADHSKLNLAAAAAVALVGGRRGRRSAIYGLAALGTTSVAVNLVAKPFGRRHRPDRTSQEVPIARHVPMPTTSSFPSGHSAAAFAFADGAGRELPAMSIPLHGIAGIVSYSRVHTGVHYPLDVLVGSLLGSALSQISGGALDGLRRRLRAR